jgi:TolA-binding protein
MVSRSGQQLGAENASAIERYLDALKTDGKGLPSRNGKVSISAVALAAGVATQNVYKNPKCRDLLEQAAQELGLSPIGREEGQAKDDPRDRRIQSLEARIASLQAEVEGLRSKLRKVAHVEQHMVETGRRVIP